MEDIYNFEDVLQLGCILNTFFRRSDVAKIGCLAQLVNVIAPIMTVPDGPAWRQSTYYPYLFASRYGRGNALRLNLDFAGYETEFCENVPYLDIASVENDGVVTVFLVNRHQSETIDVSVNLEGFSDLNDQIKRHDDLRATNPPENPDCVVPVTGKGTGIAHENLNLNLNMPPLSYHMVRLNT